MTDNTNSKDSHQELVNYVYLDLAKAVNTEHSSYMFPLMRALNDTYRFCRFCRKALQGDQSFGGEMLLPFLRNRQAQNLELLDSFIVGIAPKGAGSEKAIYTFMKSDSTLFAEFNCLLDLHGKLEGDHKGFVI